MLHGAESGVLDRAPSGKYSERHRPISEGEAFALTQHEDLPALLPVAEVDGMSEKEIKSEQRRRKATRFYFMDTLRRPTRAEIEEAAHHHHASHASRQATASIMRSKRSRRKSTTWPGSQIHQLRPALARVAGRCHLIVRSTV